MTNPRISRPSRPHRAETVLLTFLLALAALVASSTSARAAAPSKCDAAALQLSLGGAQAIDPAHANAAQTPCVDADGGLDQSVLGAASVQAVQSTTRNTPAVAAVAHSKVTGLNVGSSDAAAALAGPLSSGADTLLPQINTALAPLTGSGGVITTALAPLQLLGLQLGATDPAALQSALTTKLPAALTAALPAVAVAGVIGADASATCSAGSALLVGSTTLTGVQV